MQWYSNIVLFLSHFCDIAAVTHLNGAMLYGKKVHITLSKHSQVQMPQPGSNVSEHIFCLYHDVL